MAGVPESAECCGEMGEVKGMGWDVGSVGELFQEGSDDFVQPWGKKVGPEGRGGQWIGAVSEAE